MIFKSSNIHFRKIEKDDFGLLYKWQNDFEVFGALTDSADLYNQEDVEEFYDKIKKEKNYMVIHNEDQMAIGRVALLKEDYKQRNAEALILIGEKEYWGQGYGEEAFRLLLDYAFGELNFHRISLQVFSFNQIAKKMYEKIGFKEEGCLREALYHDGMWHDTYIMGLLKREFLKLE